MAKDTAVIVENAAPGLTPTTQARRKPSYRDILSSSALIGGSSAINVCIGVVRTKAMALLLGPAGYGVMGAYMQVAEVARSVAQMGLNGSGVRQIANAVSTGDMQRIGRTVRVLRWVSLLCGLVGAALLVTLAAPIATLTFGNDGHTSDVELLACSLFFTVVAGGQGALLQGMRRIADLAKIAVLGGLLGTALGIPLVYAFGEKGLVPTLVVMAGISLLTSWWYSRRIEVEVPPLDLATVASETTALLKLGVAFMASGLLMSGAAYAVRAIVLREAGLDAAGIYFAAWTLGGLYIGFVLQALGTDFYPRLVGAIQDHEECNRLVNEQAQVSLLLAVPGVVATLTLAPLAIALFYSAQFSGSISVLRWICLGMAVRVLTWPIGYIVVAKNAQALFLAIEVAWTVVNVGLTWWLVKAYGVDGAGMAFLGANVLHALAVYPIVHRLSGFEWSTINRKLAAQCFALITVTFAAFQALSPMQATAVGLITTLASSWICVRTLAALVSPERLPSRLQRFFTNQRNAK